MGNHRVLVSIDLGAGMKHEPSDKEWAKLKAELLNEIKSDIRREAKVARRPLRIFRLTRVVWRDVSRRFDSSLFMRWGAAVFRICCIPAAFSR